MYCIYVQFKKLNHNNFNMLIHSYIDYKNMYTSTNNVIEFKI